MSKETFPIGNVIQVPFAERMKQQYMEYAKYVINDRAVPDIRDGLKPVHRRILYGMNELKLSSSGKYKKSAKTVGIVISNFHAHGDASVYDAMVNLAQDFNMHYPLVDGRGNFGSLDRDPAAAMRYCVTGDTLVNTDSGLVPIEKITKTKLDSDNKINIRVDSFNNIVNESKLLFNSGEHETYRVETESGFEVKGTSNHPLMTLTTDKNGKPYYEWKTISELKENDYLVINLSDNQLESKLNNIKTWEARFLGVLVSEGYISSINIKTPYYRIGCSNTDKQLIEDFKIGLEKLLERVNSDSKIIEKEVYKTNTSYTEIYTHSKALYEYLNNKRQFYFGSPTKEIPEVILSANRSIQCEFLKYLYEGDGGVYNGIENKGIFYVSQSMKLLKQVQILLANLGIFSYISSCIDKRNANYTYRLEIKELYNVNKFAEKIGFVSDRKNKNLKKIIEHLSKHIRSVSKKNYVPFIADYIRSKYSKYLTNINFDRPNRFEEHKEALRKRVSKEDFELLTNLLNRNYGYQKITSITSIGKQVVYSIKVNSECHSFTANAFINHNTEAKMSRVAELMLRDVDKNTVPMKLNYDETEYEPEVLPTLFPALLANPTTGIAVGLTSSFLPHNVKDVYQAIDVIFKNLLEEKETSIDEVINIIKAPDFPTGGEILGYADAIKAYKEGHGKVILRGKYHIEDKKNKILIVFDEIPWGICKKNTVTKIVELSKEKLADVTEIRDESNMDGVRIVIECKKTANVDWIIKNIFKYTDMQSNVSMRHVALQDGKPKVNLTLLELLEAFIEHAIEVIQNRCQYDYNKLDERFHIVEAITKALETKNVTIELVSNATSLNESVESLKERYAFDDKQAKAVANLRLYTLNEESIQKYNEEYEELNTKMNFLSNILHNEMELIKYTRSEIQQVAKQFEKDERKTAIVDYVDENIDQRDFIKNEDVVVAITHNNMIKAVKANEYSAQNRGGKGVNANTREDDFVTQLYSMQTHDDLIFATNTGRFLLLPAYKIPVVSKNALGKYINNYIPLQEGEKIVNVLSYTDKEDLMVLFVTKQGRAKITSTKDLPTRARAYRAIKLRDEDELVECSIVKDLNQDLAFITEQGMLIHLKASSVNMQSRNSGGVNTVKLNDNDIVVSSLHVKEDGQIAIVTKNGIGKVCNIEDFRITNRNAKGSRCYKVNEKSGTIVGGAPIEDENTIYIITVNGKIIKLRAEDIPLKKRTGQGVKMIRFDDDDYVNAITVGPKEEEEEANE